jgi:hypothetical protein
MSRMATGVRRVVAAWFQHGGQVRSAAYAVPNDPETAD